MTDDPPEIDVNAVIARCVADYHDRCRRRAACRPANKSALFDVLAAAGITVVAASFDGSGDSGQIESIQARIHDATVALPAGEIEFIEPGKGAEFNRRMLSVEQTIEALVYDALEETLDGWQDNDGAYGDFLFDVETRTIELDFHERHMESDYSHHEF